jgi:hypothetical protein
MQALTLSLLFHWWVLSATPMMGDSPFLDRSKWLQATFRKKMEQEEKEG